MNAHVRVTVNLNILLLYPKLKLNLFDVFWMLVMIFFLIITIAAYKFYTKIIWNRAIFNLWENTVLK